MAVAKVAANSKSRAGVADIKFNVQVGSTALLKYTPATSYTTGGDAIDIAGSVPNLVPTTPVLVKLLGNGTTLGWTATYDYTNKTVQLWNGTTEATSSTDYSAKVFDMEVWSGR